MICIDMSRQSRFSHHPDEPSERSEQYLTVSQTAKLLSVHPSTIRRWIDQRILPAYRLGPKRIGVRRSDVAAVVVPHGREAKDKHSGYAGHEQLPPLTDQDRQQWKRAIAEARELQAKFLKRRGGKLFPNSAALIVQSREERTHDLTSSADE
jgi:excisionase family DNA binding protein